MASRLLSDSTFSVWKLGANREKSGWWQSPDVARERRRLKSHPLLQNTQFDVSLLLREVSALIRRGDPNSQIGAFARCVEMLRVDAQTSKTPFAQREQVARTAFRLLKRAGVGSHGSKLSSLHEELFEAAGNRLDIDGLAALAEKKGKAVVRWLKKTGKPQSVKDQQTRIECLRWTADYFQSEAELEELSKSPEQNTAAFLRRERLRQAVGRDGDLSRISVKSDWDDEFLLWAFSVPERAWMAKTPKAEGGFPEAIASAYNLTLSKPERWARLVDALSKNAKALNAHQLALSLACAIRWLLRAREKEAARALFKPYRLLSLTLSQGFSDDILSLFADTLPNQKDGPTAVPVAWKRAGALSSLSIEVCLLLGKTRFAALFGKEQKKKRLKDKEAVALVEICVRHLGELKGPVMKIGQTVSYFGWQLPGISTQTLVRLQSESAPISVSTAVEVIERELGHPISHLFCEFEETPCGVGSIGQVHRARLRTGERVAVKVQFPGVEEAIQNDIALLRICFPLFRLLSAASLHRDVLDELQSQLARECDYLNEARALQKMAHSFTDAPGLRFPKLHLDLLTKRVLVTEYIDGQTFKEFLATATQTQRNTAGRWITEYVVRSCCRGTFNSDPHPGNFLFADGKVACLDFGAVKEWDPKYSVPWAELILAGVTKDYPLFQKAIRDMDLVADPLNFNAKYFYEVYTGGSMGNTSVNEPRTMSHEELHRELVGYFNRSFMGHVYFNPQYLYGVRVYTGLVSIVASMNMENNFFGQIREICKETLPHRS